MIGLLGVLAVALTDQSTVQLADANIRLGDVASVGEQPGLRRRIIARLPDGVARLSLTRPQLLNLITRAAPALDVTINGQGSVQFTRRPTALPTHTLACFETIQPMAVGSVVAPNATRRVACDPKRPLAALRFDPGSRSVVAGHMLAAGTYLGPVRLAEPAAIERGASMVLRATSGPVTIERPVTSLQSARSTDKRVFVRTDDGVVFAATIQSEVKR